MKKKKNGGDCKGSNDGNMLLKFLKYFIIFHELYI